MGPGVGSSLSTGINPGQGGGQAAGLSRGLDSDLLVLVQVWMLILIVGLMRCFLTSR